MILRDVWIQAEESSEVAHEELLLRVLADGVEDGAVNHLLVLLALSRHGVHLLFGVKDFSLSGLVLAGLLASEVGVVETFRKLDL